MKQLNYIFLIFTLIFAGCDSDDKLIPTELPLEISEISFEATGGTQEIELGLGSDWQVTSDKDWCTVAKFGKFLIVTAPLNPTIAVRTATVTITEAGNCGSVNITQTGSKFDTFPEKVYLSAWVEEGWDDENDCETEEYNYYEKVVERDFKGNLLSETLGSLQQHADGTWWIA